MNKIKIRRSLLAIHAAFVRNELIRYKKKICGKRKRMWTRKWILRRDQLGISNTLMQEVALEELDDFKNIIRMSASKFEELLSLVEPLIQKKKKTQKRGWQFLRE